MQMLVEGLAMGAFANGYRYNADPLAKKLFQLVMTDEAFHHKFGKIWADRTVPMMTKAERDLVEDWAAHCFQSLLFNQAMPAQQAAIYASFGLDPERVAAGFEDMAAKRDPNRKMRGETNAFRVMIKTLLTGHIITERTRGFYGAYVDMDELQAEGPVMPGEAIAEDGIAYLQAINFKARGVGAGLIAAE